MKRTNLITTTMLAERMGVTPQYVRKLIADGKIKAQKVGYDWIIDERNIVHVKAKRSNTDGFTNTDTQKT